MSGAIGLVVILGLAGFIFWIWVLVDCIKVPDDSMYKAGNKLIWVLVLVFTGWIGAIIYLIVGRPDRGAGSAAPPQLTPSVPPPSIPPPPV
jgi:hypothetical protein